jgi:hypothetical protein
MIILKKTKFKEMCNKNFENEDETDNEISH